MEIPTPVYHHVKDYPDVYEPAEDTFLLMDSLEKEQKFLNQIMPHIVLEVGCGSGIVSTFLSSMLKSASAFICTDKNPQAVTCCMETAKQNGVQIEALQTDLITGLLPKLENNIDVLLFNPPYVVTPSEEILQSGLSSAWAGGLNGREVMNRFFPFVPQLLSQKGVFYLIVVKENKPSEIAETFRTWGFDSGIVMTRRSGPELLSVMKFWRKISEDRTYG